jgi:hypothetical protein
MIDLIIDLGIVALGFKHKQSLRHSSILIRHFGFSFSLIISLDGRLYPSHLALLRFKRGRISMSSNAPSLLPNHAK